MMKTKFLAWGGMLFALCAMLTVTSCSKDDGIVGGGEGTPISPETTGMVSATFTGVVTTDGMAMRDVTVTSGDQTAQTDINGVYTLDRVNVQKGRAVVKFQKAGFMTVVRSVPAKTVSRLDVSMRASEPVSFPSSSSTNVISMSTNTYAEKMLVSLPADGFVTESGAAYSGVVNASSVYLDPDDSDFADQMPGDLTAICSDNTEAQLISYGMFAVELTGGSGEKLQLKEGKKATVTFPVPDKFKGGTLPATIPLWSFNEATGLWEEEGVATLNGAGDAYVGEVSHFSWHNLDYPELRATLKVKVVDGNGGAIAGVLVDFDGQRSGYTNKDGIATCVVPSNTNMVIAIPSESYGNYAEVWNAENNDYEYDETKVVKQNVTLAPQEEKTITMTMPLRIPVISGKITNEGTGSQVCVVWIGFPGGQTIQTITDLNGNYSLLAPATYRGEATLYAQYGDAYKAQQTFTITNNDQVVNMTTNSSAPAGVGVLQVVGSGLNMRFNLPDAANDGYEAHVRVSASGLEAYAIINHQKEPGNWGMEEVNVFISNYVEGTSTYTSSGNEFQYMQEGMLMGWKQVLSQGELTVNVTKSGDTYTFKIAGAEAQFKDQSLGIWDNPAAVTFSVEFKITPTEQNQEEN